MFKRSYHSRGISFATPVKNMFRFHDFLSLKDKENHLLLRLKEAAVLQILHVYLEYYMFPSSCTNEQTKYVQYLKYTSTLRPFSICSFKLTRAMTVQVTRTEDRNSDLRREMHKQHEQRENYRKVYSFSSFFKWLEYNVG